MNTPSCRGAPPAGVLSQVQRLARDAAAAAELRGWQTHPDVVALRVEEIRTIVKAGRGRIENSDLEISATYRDLVDFQSGDLHAATAFVTGQFAVAGDKAKLLELMLVLQSGYYPQFVANLWAKTTW